MTVVSIWFEPQDDALWSVADTRISSKGRDGIRISTDSAAKLFAIPMHCYRASSQPNFRSLPFFTTSIGFAFAGDVVPALMTIATAGTFLQNLMTTGPANPPKLSDIADVVRRLAVRFSKEKLSSTQGQHGSFECAVFGWCHVLKRFAIYELRPRIEQLTFDIDCSEHLPEDHRHVVSFGTGRPRLIELIDKIAKDGDPYNRSGRLPLLATEALLRENSVDDVGGSLSIGVASKTEFRLYARVTPINPGEPPARMAFNGIDLAEEVRAVGSHHVVAINGMA